MIKESVPCFSFVDPKNKNLINIRFSSVNVSVGERRLRAIWTPELAQDIHGYHAIDAEAELTAILGQEIQNEIDNQIIRDLHNNERFYNQNTFTDAVNRFGNITNDVLIQHGHRPIDDIDVPVLGGNPPPGYDNIAFPLVRRTFARTMGMDLLTVQPLTLPTGLFHYLDYSYDDGSNILLPNYTVLPNEDGWYADGTFESKMIKMEIKPFKFNPRKTRRERRSPYVRPGIY